MNATSTSLGRTRPMGALGTAIALVLAAGATLSVALATEDDSVTQARQAVEMELHHLSQAPSTIRLRRVEVYQQSFPNTVAVCGQVSPTGTDNAFINFAAVVTTTEGEGAQVQELHLADGGTNTARTRAKTWLRCSDETKRLELRGTGKLAEPNSPPTVSTSPSSNPQAAPTNSTVTMRQGGNLRTGPSGSHSVIRTIPRGTAARVFGHAPGGWYQIGDTTPWGWMHGSMLAVQPP